MNEEKKLPAGTEYVLTVPITRDRSKSLTFYLKDIDDTVYNMVKSLVDQKKELEAVRQCIKALVLPGSDPVEQLNFIGTQAAGPKMLELITPMDAELKKS